MPTRFAAQFARTGAPSLVRQFGEPLIYYRRGGNVARLISGIVERNVAVESSTGTTSQEILIRVLDNSTTGISATEVNDQTDEIAVPLVTGGTAVRRQVTRVNDDSNGFIRFMVR